MAQVKIPTYLVPSFVERMRWETRRKAALIDLSQRKIDPHIEWDGLLDHYNILFHEELSKDLVFRRFFEELKSLSCQTELRGRKFIDVSSDMKKEIDGLVRV